MAFYKGTLTPLIGIGACVGEPYQLSRRGWINNTAG